MEDCRQRKRYTEFYEIKGIIDIKDKWEQNIVSLRKKQRSETFVKNRELKIENKDLKGLEPATKFDESKKLAIQNFFYNQLKVYAKWLDTCENESTDIVRVLNSLVINASEYDGRIEELFTYLPFSTVEEFFESILKLLKGSLIKERIESLRILTGN